ncbi:hypothetical protein [Ruminococcus sp.]|uniref:hypothetical protein n=1 Tax=Ruminococcus sp. TaxID=41978 RepID=UPI0025FDCEAD|nr:hypothetical protein [Ruminococcus sp.]MCI5817178.1 hypothetical protein [Ruminococcus sp.]MDY4962871.1 hypothetical protein [Ruminococcus callidus]
MKKKRRKQALQWAEIAILLVIMAGVFLIQQRTGCWLDVRYEPLLYGLILGLYGLTRAVLNRFLARNADRF